MRTPKTVAGKLIVMLGVHPASKEKGGISSVIDVYRASGLFSRWPILYIGTMASGSSATKMRVAFSAFLAFARALLCGRVALVHAQTASRASFWRKSAFMVLALLARKPVILHLHGGEFGQFYRDECGPLRQWAVRRIVSAVDVVVVLSSRGKDLIESIAPAARVRIIANPIPIPAAASDANERDPNALLFLGRFGRQKGIFDLLQAVAVVRRRFPNVRLRCGGDGDTAGVVAHARELGIESHVDMLGWVSGATKERELQRASVYVLPSYAEGLPMGVLEAMASGTPTVATTVGGIPDAIENSVHGFLIAPGDVTALAERIELLLGDAELRSRLGAAARRKAEEVFSTEKVLDQVEDLYRRFGVPPRRLGRMEDRSSDKDASAQRAPYNA